MVVDLEFGLENDVEPPGQAKDDDDTHEPDEEQLKRILAAKRLSEGNCTKPMLATGHLANIVGRKNSLHLFGESLPPVTEGELLRHLSHHTSQNMDSTSSGTSSGHSSSLRRHLTGGSGSNNKRNSQDEHATASCSSSTSLDGSSLARSPTRRRSSTVSQCSSVLSEATRQQLNFDLSPDLAPDSSILEANAMSPCSFERPASPEPFRSFESPSVDYDNPASFEMRPESRMSANSPALCNQSEEDDGSATMQRGVMQMRMTDADRDEAQQTQPEDSHTDSPLDLGPNNDNLLSMS